MQFIRLPKPMDIAERVLPKLAADWVDTYSVQSIKIIVLQQLWVKMLVSWVIEWSKSWMPHPRTCRNLTHWAWAKWDMSNYDLFRIIPDQGCQQRVTLSLESICTIPSQAKASDVNMPKLRQHSSNHGMPCFVNVFGTFRRTGNQPNKNQGVLFRSTKDIFLIITICEIQRPGILIAWKISQVSLVRCTYDWHNRRSGRKLILCIPRLIARIYVSVDSTALIVSDTHRFKIEMRLNWEMYQKELDTFPNIPVV